MKENPRFKVTPIEEMQNWPLFRCFVQRVIGDPKVKELEYQRFDVYGSSAEHCQSNAQDLLNVLNRPRDKPWNMRAPIRQELKHTVYAGSENAWSFISTDELPQEEKLLFEAALSGATRPLLPSYPYAAYWWDYENWCQGGSRFD